MGGGGGGGGKLVSGNGFRGREDMDAITSGRSLEEVKGPYLF